MSGAVAVCSVLASIVVIPFLETKISGVMNRLSSSKETPKGGSMIDKSWTAAKNVFYGVAGALVQTRRNELRGLAVSSAI
ncbi:hypothetical protein [Nocardia pneumoniae]|uniref:hypothetical protein n=1 Tax=Nocardia pneumoniae TaxID=228601 RepID=UPI0012F6ABAB|nr:hypothetical protein [Nocardia pneumoniae]